MSEKTVIFGPTGAVVSASRQLDRVELRKGLMEWFRQFADFAEHFQVGLHCSRCKTDLIAKNSDGDKLFSTACECREFIGTNRDYVEPTKH